MSIPREIRARRGDWILEKWLALLNFIDRSNKIVRGAGVRISYLPSGGVYIYAEDNFNPWASPFKVSFTGREARVGVGMVNGTVPAIKQSDGKFVRLDGTIEGEESTTLDAPLLKLNELNNFRSYIALKLTFTEEPVQFDPIDLSAAQIVHVDELPQLFSQGGSVINDDNSTLYPLAVLYSKNKKITRSFQIVHHNLNHRFMRGSLEAGKPSRHLFWAA